MVDSFKYIQSELKRHFGHRIIITEICGKQNVVTFRSTASKILHDFHQEKNKSVDQQPKSSKQLQDWLRMTSKESSNQEYISWVWWYILCCQSNWVPPWFSENISRCTVMWKWCDHKACITWTSNNTGNTSTCSFSSSTIRIRCSDAPPFPVQIPDRFSTQTWFLFFLL